MACLSDPTDLALSRELLPFAERLFARFPGLVAALGDPQLPELFDLPRDGESAVRIKDVGTQQVVQVSLQRRCSLLGTQTPDARPYWPQTLGRVGCAVPGLKEPARAAPLAPPFGQACAAALDCSGTVSVTDVGSGHLGHRPCGTRTAASSEGLHQKAARNLLRDDSATTIPDITGPRKAVPRSSGLPRSQPLRQGHEPEGAGFVEPASPRSPGGHSPWGVGSPQRRRSSDRFGRGAARGGSRGDTPTAAVAAAKGAAEEAGTAEEGSRDCRPLDAGGTADAQPKVLPVPVHARPQPAAMNGRSGGVATSVDGAAATAAESAAADASVLSDRPARAIMEPVGPRSPSRRFANEQPQQVVGCDDGAELACYGPQTKKPVRQTSDFNLSLRQRRQKLGSRPITMDSLTRTSPKAELQQASSEEIKDPEVILEKSSALRLQQPLPGAFPHQRTIFFFDWDDTLCPTTWIRSVLNDQINDRLEWDTKANATMVDWCDMVPRWFRHKLPDDDSFNEIMKVLQRRVIHVIKVAQSLGVVCIVTNSLPGWVSMTIKKWLPWLTPSVNGHGMARPPIKVLYSQEVKALVPPGQEQPAWVPGIDRYALMKRDAMSIALSEVDELYRTSFKAEADSPFPRRSCCSSSDGKRVFSVVSIGNDEAEMCGAELATLGYGSWCQHHREATPGAAAPKPWRSPRAVSVHHPNKQLRRKPWLKCVKFTEFPDVRDLVAHLEETARLLPELAGLSGHARHDLVARFAESPSPSAGQAEAGRMSTQKAMSAPMQRLAPSKFQSSSRRVCGLLLQDI